MKVKLILAGIIVLIATNFSVAQQAVKPKGLQVHLEMVRDAQNPGQRIQDNQKGNPLAHVPASAKHKIKFVIKLINESNISKIHAKMGRTDGGNQIFEIVANYDGQNLPAGVTLVKQDGLVLLEIGEHSNIQNFYAEVRLEDVSGGFTLPVKYTNTAQ